MVRMPVEESPTSVIKNHQTPVKEPADPMLMDGPPSSIKKEVASEGSMEFKANPDFLKQLNNQMEKNDELFYEEKARHVEEEVQIQEAAPTDFKKREIEHLRRKAEVE